MEYKIYKKTYKVPNKIKIFRDQKNFKNKLF